MATYSGNVNVEASGRPNRVALFVTCLADALFPRVALATARLLARLGVEVEFPGAQTCCGQPAFNAGYRREARRVARHFVETFAPYDAIVCPSGSCAAMVRDHYEGLLEEDGALLESARAIAKRTYELSLFLTQVLGIERLEGRYPHRVTWHDSCHALRSLGVREEPRRLLRGLKDLEFRELPGADACCGFGGLFSVKYPELSCALLEDKLTRLEATGADVVAAADASCLMHIEGGLRRRGSRMRVAHLAQILDEATAC